MAARKTTAAKKTADAARRPITRVTARGDWEDPFSGLLVYHGSPVCEQSGAVRDGDEAYLPSGVIEESQDPAPAADEAPDTTDEG